MGDVFNAAEGSLVADLSEEDEPQVEAFEVNEGPPPSDGKRRVRRWTPQEHALLLETVDAMGEQVKWADVAAKIHGRTGKQCRERWLNCRPEQKKGGWTPEEEEMIARMYAEHGSAWSRMASALPNRTENACKNHWNAFYRCKNLAQRPAGLLKTFITMLREGARPDMRTLQRAIRAHAAASKAMEAPSPMQMPSALPSQAKEGSLSTSQTASNPGCPQQLSRPCTNSYLEGSNTASPTAMHFRCSGPYNATSNHMDATICNQMLIHDSCSETQNSHQSFGLATGGGRLLSGLARTIPPNHLGNMAAACPPGPFSPHMSCHTGSPPTLDPQIPRSSLQGSPHTSYDSQHMGSTTPNPVCPGWGSNDGAADWNIADIHDTLLDIRTSVTSEADMYTMPTFGSRTGMNAYGAGYTVSGRGGPEHPPVQGSQLDNLHQTMTKVREQMDSLRCMAQAQPMEAPTPLQHVIREQLQTLEAMLQRLQSLVPLSEDPRRSMEHLSEGMQVHNSAVLPPSAGVTQDIQSNTGSGLKRLRVVHESASGSPAPAAPVKRLQTLGCTPLDLHADAGRTSSCLAPTLNLDRGSSEHQWAHGNNPTAARQASAPLPHTSHKLMDEMQHVQSMGMDVATPNSLAGIFGDRAGAGQPMHQPELSMMPSWDHLPSRPSLPPAARHLSMDAHATGMPEMHRMQGPDTMVVQNTEPLTSAFQMLGGGGRDAAFSHPNDGAATRRDSLPMQHCFNRAMHKEGAPWTQDPDGTLDVKLPSFRSLDTVFGVGGSTFGRPMADMHGPDDGDNPLPSFTQYKSGGPPRTSANSVKNCQLPSNPGFGDLTGDGELPHRLSILSNLQASDDEFGTAIYWSNSLALSDRPGGASMPGNGEAMMSKDAGLCKAGPRAGAATLTGEGSSEPVNLPADAMLPYAAQHAGIHHRHSLEHMWEDDGLVSDLLA